MRGAPLCCSPLHSRLDAKRPGNFLPGTQIEQTIQILCCLFAAIYPGADGLARWLGPVLEWVLFGFLIVRQMRPRVLVAELLRTRVRGLFGDAALGFVRRQFVGGIEVPPARIAAILIGPRTCWSGHDTCRTRRNLRSF